MRLATLHIENTTACNLRCRHCHRDGLPVVSISRDAFARLLALVRRDKPHCLLYGNGEPLTHPEFEAQFTSLCRDALSVEVQTNAQLLTPERVARMFAADPSMRWTILRVSVDGATPAVYESIRRGGLFARLREHLAAFRDERARSGHPVSLRLECVCQPGNAADLPGVARLAHEFDAERVRFSDFRQREEDGGRTLNVTNDHDFLLEPLVEAYSFCRATGIAIDVSDETRLALGWTADGDRLRADRPCAPREHCEVPESVAFVAANGDVWPCCIVPEPMGNLDAEDFDAIWTGPRFEAFRSALREGKYPHPRCAACVIWRTI